LTKRGHFFGLHKTGLSRFQITIGCLGGIPSRPDLGLRALALGNIAVDENEAAIRNRIPADLDDSPVRPRPLLTKLLIGIFQTAAHFRLDVLCPKLAALGENDRAATGYLPAAEFQRTADEFFARPHESIRGWERAADAQTRIVATLDDIARRAPGTGPIAVISHGGVGALLMCQFKRVAISRGRAAGHVGRALLPVPDARRRPCPWLDADRRRVVALDAGAILLRAPIR